MSNEKTEARIRRHQRARKKIAGTTERPRLSVYRSLKNIYAQVIDDSRGCTLAAASSLSKGAKIALGGNKDAAKLVGSRIATLAKSAGVTTVVFDRGGYLYHGNVKVLAEAAREGGLIF